ncbi:MAG: response regulator [Desulfobulbus sp.]|nr:response regulator [Desulfobulbus sp.]
MSTPPAHILLVDDEEGIIDITCYRIHKLGYQVSAHTSALHALADFREHPDRYQVVITDFFMPEMDGAHLAQALKSIRPDVPIILCTGGHSGYSDQDLFANGIDRILYKPVSQKSLTDILTLMIT